MYTDISHSAASNRDSWKYVYTGKELHDYAHNLVQYYLSVEETQRKLMSEYMADRSVSTLSKKVDSCKKLIGEAGMQHEKCVVYAHEFARNPDREYHLTVADVVFFGIAGTKAVIGESEE